MKLISLEKEFIKACSRHPNLKLLESQWRFDKELISKALQNISSVFPHYSRHDASHSKQIIVNIERILGSRVKNLSATDMWLILEAAYAHDIGMVITHKQIEDLDSPEFSHFISEIASQPEHNLNSFAAEWKESKAELPTGSNSHKFLNKYIQLIAEWYRRKHPENSAKIIRNPYAEIGLDSPRNELLPNRLFNCLASICHAHGKSFEETLNLPFSETGMATEDCHPRYVAFLLRLGDLLDIDDNRFCPVMMRMSGAELPSDSFAHYEKHRSIKHFRLDPERIEIETVCPSPEAYEQAHQWFKWLEDEHYKLSQNWNIIAPSKKHGHLPVLSSPKVLIEEPFLTIEEGKRPKFKVNEDATLKLLRSAGLYSKRDESIREILQNAVDSCLISIWMSNKERIKDLNPASPELQEIYQSHTIRAELKRDAHDPKLCHLIVSDNGTGISESDLVHMLEAGSSAKNKRKNKLIHEMPIWYRPSGNFGIGLQSIYLLSDSFSITTKSIFTNEALKITFSSPERNSVAIKRIPADSIGYGATIELKIQLPEFPEKISFPEGPFRSALQEKLFAYDFTRENSNLQDHEEITLLKSIYEFSTGSPIKVHVGGEIFAPPQEDKFFSSKENILLSNIEIDLDNRGNATLFRGQSFKGLSPNVEHFSCVADFYSHQASDFLSYNREKILEDAVAPARRSLVNTILEYIENKFESLTPHEQSIAAAIHFLHDKSDQIKYSTQLMNFPIQIDAPEHRTLTLSEVIEKIKNEEIIKIDQINPDNKTPTPNHPKTLMLIAHTSHSTLTLLKLLSGQFGLFYQETRGHSRQRALEFSKIDIQPLSDEIIAETVLRKASSFEVGSRALFPVWGKYRALAVEVDAPWARRFWREGYDIQYMVLPCLFRASEAAIVEADETLIRWAHSHRKQNEVSLEAFKELYEELVSHLQRIYS